MENKDWYTLNDLVEMTRITYSKIRSTVYVLRNSGQITVRDNPFDSRILEVHKDSVPVIKRTLGLD